MLLFELTKDTPYLALSGEIWSVFYEYFNRNWSCYKGFLLYYHDVMTYGSFSALLTLCVGEFISHWWIPLTKGQLCGFEWFYVGLHKLLTLKHRETHGCVVSTVATDALVLKHQAISILSTD